MSRSPRGAVAVTSLPRARSDMAPSGVDRDERFLWQLCDVLAAAEAGDARARVRTRRGGVHGELARRVNALAAHLEAVDRLNQELGRANAALDAFAACAAEDLLEPLDALAGLLELLDAQLGDELGEVATELVDRSLALAGRQRTRVASLLEHAQATHARVDLDPVDLRGAVTQARERASDCPSEVHVDDSAVATLCADHLSLVRVLELLLRRAARLGAERAAVTATEDGPWVVVQVSDDGDSPSSGGLAAMFGTHDPDATLGNAECRRLVERHGGALWAGPHEPRGTSVHFTLPARRAR